MTLFRINILLIIFLAVSNLHAQGISDSLNLLAGTKQPNQLKSKFDKQINTYYLNSGFIYNLTKPNWEIGIFENFNSTFIRSGEKSIRDEQIFALTSSYRISEQLKTGLQVNSTILSDNRRIEINQASVSSLQGFLGYSPISNVIISPFIGFSNNRQIGQIDNGMVYGAEGLVDELNISDFVFSSELKYRNEDVSPRRNLQRYINLLVENKFDKEVSNGVNFRYVQQRKDFYYEADSIISLQFNVANNIQSRIETSYFIQDRLYLNSFLNLFTLDLAGKVMWRTIDRDTRYRSLQNISSSVFDTKIDEVRLELESITSYNSENFNGAIKLLISERDEKHITKNFEGASQLLFEERTRTESRKNNNSSRASLSLIGEYIFSPKDRLLFSLLQNKLKYDTPSIDNNDDRDEILSIVRLRYNRIMNPFLETFISLEGTYNHTVYIFAERSSNNNVNRILRLTTGGVYRGKNISTLNTFEVSANYTVYDFEDTNPNFRSFSFRQFTATDSTTIALSKRFSVGLYGYIKLSEQGDLKWKSFATKPTRFLEEIFAEPKLIINKEPVTFAAGIRYFTINTYNFKGREKIRFSHYRSIGPVSEISFRIEESLLCRFYGWYEFINLNYETESQQVNVTLDVNWNF